MTVSDTTDWPTSHLRAADIAYAALTRDPDPMTFDCDTLTRDTGVDLGLPEGVVPLPRLRDWLLAHPNSYAPRDAVWRTLVLRARLDDPAWVVAAVGMAMPALIRFAGQLAAGHRGDPEDIDNENLTGFLEELRDKLDLAKPAPYSSLCFAAFRAGRRERLAQDAYVPVEDIERVPVGPRQPQRPYGHPDLLIERAASLGLIDAEDVPAWIDVRLARRSIEPIAVRLGLEVETLRKRLARADTRIAAALASGLLTDAVSPEAAEKLAAQAKNRDKVRAGKAAARQHGDTTARPRRGPAPAMAA